MMNEDTINDPYEHVNCDLFYVTTSIPGKGCDIDAFETQFSVQCNCIGSCDDVKICECIGYKHGNNNYVKNSNGILLLKATLDYGDNDRSAVILECGENCRCNVKKEYCDNRLLQRGPSPNLEIVPTGPKGYGVVSNIVLERGQFVCEYAGEVIGRTEAVRRMKSDEGGANYIFWLNEYLANDVKLEFAIDATVIGNIGRYINHSCDPNCKVVPVRTTNSIVPKLAIFAMKIIHPREEITYDYSGGLEITFIDVIPDKAKLCYCNSTKCKKYLPYNQLPH